MKPTTASAQSFNGVAQRIDSVDAFIMQGIQERLLSVFNTPTVWTTSTDKVKALEKLFPDSNKKLEYPYAILMLNSWQKAEDRGSLRAASLRGTRVMINTDETNSWNTRFLPVDFSIGVEWYGSSYKDMLDMGRRWIFLAQRGNLNFQVEYGQTTFDIKMLPDSSVNFPLREADPDNVQEYMVALTMVVQGFISETEPINVTVVNTVEINGAVEGDLTPEGTLWAFKTPPLVR